ncbi:hypothetical protein CDIK_2297 [Cucumispora dikerogammari]|nr:hypothetical protein CDIK_2297 [Cucumispora dikerogammari]
MKVIITNAGNRIIKDEDIQAFIDSIETPEKVTFLEIYVSYIKLSLAEIISAKIKEMPKLKHIKLISLNPSISYKEREIILSKLFENINPVFIQSINISYINFFSKLPKVLYDFFAAATNLEYLKINNCYLGYRGSILLLISLVKNKSRIKYLDISFNELEWKDDIAGRLINRLKFLERLKIKNNLIDNRILTAFIKNIRAKKFEILNVSENDLNQLSCLLLGKMFGKHEMWKLKMSKCDISDEGLQKFLQGWNENINTESNDKYLPISLAELALNKLEFTNRDEISDNMRSSSKHEENEVEEDESFFNQVLDLSNNHITQTGIDDLTKFLADKKSIMLYITKKISEDASKLIEVVRDNQGMVVVVNPDAIYYHYDESYEYYNDYWSYGSYSSY